MGRGARSPLRKRRESFFATFLSAIVAFSFFVTIQAVAQDPTVVVPTDPTVDRINWAAASRGTTTRVIGTGQLFNAPLSVLTDGQPNTIDEWIAISVPSHQALEFDLGALRQVDYIQFHLWDGDNRYMQYQLETSADGITYSMLADKHATEEHGLQRIRFLLTPVRYIRLSAVGTSPYPWVTLIDEVLAVGPGTTTPLATQELTLLPSHSGANSLVGKKLEVGAGVYEVTYLRGAVSRYSTDTANGGRTWEGGFETSLPFASKSYSFNSIHPKYSLFASPSLTEATLKSDGDNQGRFTFLAPTHGQVSFWFTNVGGAITRGSVTLQIRQLSGPNETLTERIRDSMVRSVLQEQVALANWGSWPTNRSCFSCHILSEGPVGLVESRRKIPTLPVSKTLEKDIRAAFKEWQSPDGNITQLPGGGGDFFTTQTAMGAWAMSRYLDNSNTENLFRLARAENFLKLRENPQGGLDSDHTDGNATKMYFEGSPSATLSSGYIDSQIELIKYIRTASFVSHPTASVGSTDVIINNDITDTLDLRITRVTGVTGVKIVVKDTFDAAANVVLNEIEAIDGPTKRLFNSAAANFSQAGFPVSNLVDQNVIRANGWAYYPHSVRVTPAEAVLSFGSATSFDRIRITQRYGGYALKKFSLLFTRDSNPTLSSNFSSLHVTNVGLESDAQDTPLASIRKIAALYVSPGWQYGRNLRTAANTLLGLKHSLPYLLPANVPAAESRITEIVNYIRSKQLPSGGWNDTSDPTLAPESFHTAQALKALIDAQSPILDDSVIRGVEYLLDTQRQDGMWSSPSLATLLASTTGVQIALPTVFDEVVHSSAQGDRVIEDLLARGDISSVRLLWTPIDGAVSYNIYRKAPSGSFEKIRDKFTTLDGSFLDSAVTPGTLYSYIVRWNDGLGKESGASTEAGATPYSGECGGIGVAPDIISVPVTRGTELSPYLYNVRALDKDPGDEIRYSLEEFPTGMNIDRTTGAIRWTPTQAQRGIHFVRVNATDSLGHLATQRYRILVTDPSVNLPPSITSDPSRIATESHRWVYRVAAFSKGATSQLTYRVLQGPSGVSFENASPTGESTSPGLFWTPSATQLGDQLIRISVTDQRGLSTTQTFTVTVKPNAPPQFFSSPLDRAGTLSAYGYEPLALDPDGDTLIFALSNAPAGMTVNPQTGRIDWLTPGSPSTISGIILTASDPFGKSADQLININVTQNQPPVIRSSPNDEAGIGVPYEYQVDAIDPEFGPLSYGLSKAPPGMSVSPSGRITWIPVATQQGTHDVEVQVADTGGLSTIQPYALTVRVGASTQMIKTPSPAPGTVIDSPETIRALVNPQGVGPFTCESKFIRSGETDGPVVGTLSHSSGVLADGTLGTIDPRSFANDSYTLKVTCVRGPRTITEDIPYIINQHYKPGRFSLAIQDLSIPVGTLPIKVERVYDSLDRSAGDFGKGWRLRLPGKISDSAKETPSAESYSATTRVNVTLADGRRVGFTFAPQPVSGFFAFLFAPHFVGDGGVFDRLSVESSSVIQTGNLFTKLSGVFNPQRFFLTTREQMQYTLDEVDGLVEVRDRSNNFLKINRNSFEHSSGVSVQLVRDDLGRISQIRDLNGGTIHYEYDIAGHLVSVVNQLGERTRYRYDASGLLLQVLDSLGNVILQNNFDSSGKLVSQTDANGKTTSVDYDLNSDTENVTDRNGNTWRIGYDENGNILRRIDPFGNETRYTYDSNFNLLSETNPLGEVRSFTYDERGNRLSERNALGETTSYTYNSFNQPTSETSPRGFTSTREYDSIGRLIRTTDTLGHVTNFIVNSVGLPLSETDPLGHTTTFEYDSAFRPARIRDPLGYSTYILHDANGNPVLFRREKIIGGGSGSEVSISAQFDAANRLTSATDGEGNTVRAEYNARGEMVSVTDPLGKVRRFEYDLTGNRTKTINPDGTFELSAFDGEQSRVQSTDALGRVTNYIFDSARRAVRTISPDGAIAQTTYDPAGRAVASIDPRGNTTTTEFDAAGRVTKEINPLGAFSTRSYDADGNMVSMTDELGRTSSYEFDGNNRIIKTIYPDGTFSLTEYDAAGRSISTTDQLGHTTHFTYDALGRVVDQVDPSGAHTRTTYDALGNRASMEDALGNTTFYEYDNSARLVRTLYPRGGSDTFTYDANGNRLTVTDANGRTTTSTYDLLNRLLTETDGRGAVTTYSYDAAGNKLSVVDPVGNRSEWTYDVMNRVTSEKDPTGKIIQYSYDLSGNKSSETRRNGKRFEFGFDALDRLISEKWFTGSTLVNTVTTSYDVRGNILSEQDSTSRYASTYDAQDRLITNDNAGSPGLPHLRLTYTYDSSGKPLTVSDGDVVSESQYDSRSHLSSKRWSGSSISPARFDFSYNNRGDRTQVDRFKNLSGTQRIGQSLYDYDAERHLVSLIHRNSSLIQAVGHLYQYNSGGEVSSWSRNGSPTTYTYDASGELLSALPAETFSYDLNGNRTSVTTGTANRALGDGTFNYSYDEEGNLTKKTQLSNGEVTDYVYDHRNRLTSVTRKSSGGTTLSTSSYAYDVKNRRIRKTVNGVTTYSLYNDEDTWADYDSGLNITARYLYGERIDEILARHRPSDGLMCYLPDKLGSIQDISDLSGNPVFTSLYKAFGQITQEIGTLFSGDRFRFTGREYDSETGLYYYRARYYDPILGRFISEDPIRFEAGDLNVYRYVGNRPNGGTDPSGNNETSETGIFASSGPAGAVSRGLSREALAKTQIIESIIRVDGLTETVGGIGRIAIFAEETSVGLPVSKGFRLILAFAGAAMQAVTLDASAGFPVASTGFSYARQLDDWLEIQIKAIWPDRRPYDITSETMVEPGDCDPLTYDDLSSAKKDKCDLTKGASCDQNDKLQSVVVKKIQIFKDCIDARTDLDNECYRGGNEGHRKAVDGLESAYYNCIDRLRELRPRGK